MMSLTTIKAGSLVKKQFQYKLNAYIGVFSSMMILQGLAIFFSLLGSSGMSSTSSHGLSISIDYYSADTVIMFTSLWAFISAVLITTKIYREDDYTFVTNRITANLSNIAFLVLASLIGGFTAVMSGYFVRTYIYYFFDHDQLIGIGTGQDVQLLLTGMTATILYILLFSSLGYLAGTLVQLNRIFVVVLPVLVIGLQMNAIINQKINIFEFYFQESSILMFIPKIIVTVAVLFSIASLLSNRMEVRR
ncbi:hypothetical protein VBD025_02505 [Virgibacillus flavescens]|uniref:hypothetical protein n=1 Tax=Virgibacillus flavescens TaxID=1611422 RepID=UPI003D358171